MDIVVNEPNAMGKIADFNAQQVPEEIKNTVVNLEDISKSLSSNEPMGNTTVTSGGKDIAQVVPEIKKEEPKVEEKKEEKKETPKVSPVLKAPDEKKEEKIAPKVEVTPKIEEKKEEETFKPAIKPITPLRAEEKKDDFSYDGYSQQEVTNMKNMSRQSREAYVDLIKQNKELAKLKDSLYLQADGAYTLSPEYNQLQQKGYRAMNETQAWERALLDIKAGKSFKPPIGIDPKTGNVVLGQEVAPSDQLEIQVANNLQKCNLELGKIENEVQTYPQRYKQQVGTDLQAIRDTQKAMFAWHTDPKLLEHKLTIEGVGDRTISQIKQDMKAMWPIYMQNHPAIDVLGDMMVSLRIRDEELREALKGQKAAEIERNEVKRGEPSSAAAPDAQSSKSRTKNGMPDTFVAPPADLRL